jgi:hypothetical protein
MTKWYCHECNNGPCFKTTPSFKELPSDEQRICSNGEYEGTRIFYRMCVMNGGKGGE